MLRNRPAPSRATPATLCQKCLKKGHYSYECTSSVQERPYTSRASRTQQLANPKLRPELSTKVPDEFIKIKPRPNNPPPSQKRSRDQQQREGEASPSLDRRERSRSASYASVSTISTSRSRSTNLSRSPERLSYPSQESRDLGRRGKPGSEKTADLRSAYEASGRRRGRKRDRSFSSSSSRQENDREPQIRRRRSSVSPALRGRSLYSNFKSNTSSSESRSHSRRNRSAEGNDEDHQEYSERPKNISRRGKNVSNKTSRINDHGRSGRVRSLSPYSKRLMLTRAMNTNATSR